MWQIQHWWKFSFFIFFLHYSVANELEKNQNCALISFDEKLNETFLGLTHHILDIKKINCEIHLTGLKWWFLQTAYTVDICRRPVHIKKNGHAYLAQSSTCQTEVKVAPDLVINQEDPYCTVKTEFFRLLEFKGLLYAEGEKDTPGSQHYHLNCIYLLTKDYFENQRIYNISSQQKNSNPTEDDIIVKEY